MGSIIDSATKVLIDPWNHEFSMPGKCAASLLSAAIFVGSLGTVQLASFGWRYYRDIKENDTQDAISEKISALVQKIFPSTQASPSIQLPNQASPSIQLKDILKKEEYNQLPLYSEKPLPKSAMLPDFINLQRPITIVQQMGDDGKIQTFIAFKILADTNSKEQPNAKWIEQSVMYLQVSEDNLIAVCPMKDQNMMSELARVDKKDQIALLNSVMNDVTFTKEDKHHNVSYRLSKEAPSYISIDSLENKDLTNALKGTFGFTELPLYSKEPLSKEAELPDFKDLRDPITLLKVIGSDDKIHTLIAFKIKASGKSEESTLVDFLVLYSDVEKDGVYLVGEASDTLPETKINADDQGELFRAIFKKTPFERESGTFNMSYELTSMLR